MYICEIHGNLNIEWCDMCNTIVKCDCKDIVTTRLKDIAYECDDGGRNVTIYMAYCKCCGKAKGVSLKQIESEE